MRIEEDLKESAAKYADHAENEILKLQQVYLKKYHPRKYAHSTEVVPNKRVGGKVSALFRGRPEPTKPAKSDEGITDVTHVFQLGFLN